MKKVIYAALILVFVLASAEGNKAFFGTAIYGQTKKKDKDKEKEEEKSKEKDKTKEKDNNKDKSKTNDKSKKDNKSKTGKDAKDKKDVKEEEAPVEDPKSVKKDDKNPKFVNIMSAYYDLPLDRLIQIQNYLQRKKEENPRDRSADGKNLRDGFVKEKNVDRGYLHLQWPGDASYTRLQFFQSKERDVNLMAIETYECRPSCKGTFNIWTRDTTGWKDATDKMPQPDLKYVRKKLKDAYKKEFSDLEMYESNGYSNDNALLDALEYTISPEENKIIVREKKLQTELYNILWDDKRNVLFSVTK